MGEGDRLMRRLGERVRRAAEEHGVPATLEAILDGLDRLEDRRGNAGEGPGEPPSSQSCSTLEEFRRKRSAWRARRAEHVGAAIRRGKTPSIVGRDAND